MRRQEADVAAAANACLATSKRRHGGGNCHGRAGGANYEFFALLREEARKGGPDPRQGKWKRLMVSAGLLEFQQAIQAESQEMLNQANETLQEAILERKTGSAAVRRTCKRDEPFAVAEWCWTRQRSRGSRPGIGVLREVYDLIVREAERQVPPQLAWCDLMRAETDAEQRQILSDNAGMMTPELAEMLTMLAQEMSADRPEMAERVRALQAMAAMRVAQGGPRVGWRLADRPDPKIRANPGRKWVARLLVGALSRRKPCPRTVTT